MADELIFKRTSILVIMDGKGTLALFPASSFPDHAKPGDQFSTKIHMPDIQTQAEGFTLLIEIQPDSTSATGEKVPQQGLGLIIDFFDPPALRGTRYEIGKLTKIDKKIGLNEYFLENN